jgi:hypothetical protein
MGRASYSPNVGVRLGVVRAGRVGVSLLAARSRAALDVALGAPGVLTVSIASDDGVLIGAFQRRAGLSGLDGLGPLRRRGSGGPEVRVAAGSVHVLLALASPGAIVACDEKRIVNRHVRPLLRALAKTGHLAHFFGRDWVSVKGQPVAWVGFGHDAGTRRTVFEAVVAIGAPYVVAGRERQSTRGKEPGVVAALPERLVEAIVEAYGRDVEAVEAGEVEGAVAVGVAAGEEAAAPGQEPPWAATREEVIGTIGAGRDARGVLRVGGDLLVSRDALARLEIAVAGAIAQDAEGVGRAVDDALAAPGVALDGVRSLASVRDCVVEALGLS